MRTWFAAMLLLLTSAAAMAQVDTAYRTTDPFLSWDETNKEYVRSENMGEVQFLKYYKRKTGGEAYEKGYADKKAQITCTNCPTITNYCNNFKLDVSNFTTAKAILEDKGFIAFTGINDGSTNALSYASSTALYNTNLYDPEDNARISVIRKGTATLVDKTGNISIPVIPPGENYSIRLGNKRANYEREALVMKINVTSANRFISYKYAYSFMDSPHDSTDQPYVKFRILDANGNEITDCANFLYVQPKQGGKYWQDWTENYADLSARINSTVYLYFEVGDCTQGGHYGYAYFNLNCKSAAPNVFNYTICPSTTQVFSMDFLNNFYNPVATVTTGNATITDRKLTVNFNNTGTSVVTVKVSDASRPGCDIFYTYNFNVVYTPSSCDPNFDLSGTGCTLQRFKLAASTLGSYSSPEYKVTWAVSPDGRRELISGNEYVTFCEPGTKTVTLKITKDGVVVKQISKNVIIEDCAGFRKPLILPDTICYKEPLALTHQLFPDFKNSIYTHSWEISGNPERSSSGGTDYAAFNTIGSHTVKLSLVHTNSGCSFSTSDKVFVKDCKGELVCCPTSFAPDAGNYYFSGWVYFKNTVPLTKFPHYKITVKYGSDHQQTFILKPQLYSGIEDWYQVMGNVTVGSSATELEVQMVNPSDESVAFDDIRMQPFNSTMKGYVFDNVTKRMVAELDENNYATFYEYDEEGNLIRLKKETERGIMTIKESNQNQVKK